VRVVPDLTGRVAVVTGANTGIGRTTALGLAARGCGVVLAGRSEERTRPVVDEIRGAHGDGAAEYLALDLGDLASVRRAAETYLGGDRPLHLLVNNAGLAGQRGLTVDGFELAFGTNHLGPFLLTTLLLDRIVASAPARIVNVSSGNHFHAKGIDFDAVQLPTRTFVGLHEYNVSKLANVAFTQELARRLDPAAVSVFAVNPGPVATDVWRRMPRPVYAVFRAVRRLKSSEEGAQPSLFAACEPGLEEHSGGYVDEDGAFLEPSPVATPELARELWDHSEAWVALPRW
jgi:NAD(P)-dependent dehydrogenase (short-subunit alcohol dehydrogenase family)